MASLTYRLFRYTLAGKMGKDLEKELDEAVAGIFAQRAEEARQAEERKQKELKKLNEAALWVNRINKDYEGKVPAFQEKYFREHMSQDLLAFLAKFGEKIQKKLGLKFVPEMKIDWTSGRSFGPYPARVTEIASFNEERAHILEVLNRGDKPDFRVTYQGHNWRGKEIDAYFGAILKRNGEIEWFVADKYQGNYSTSNTDIRKMVDFFAKILASDNPRDYLSHYESHWERETESSRW